MPNALVAAPAAAAVISPIAVAAYWMATRRFGERPLRRLGITGGTLLLMAGAGAAYAWWTASAVVGDRGPSHSHVRVDVRVEGLTATAMRGRMNISTS